jgi:hypothetical protein
MVSAVRLRVGAPVSRDLCRRGVSGITTQNKPRSHCHRRSARVRDPPVDMLCVKGGGHYAGGRRVARCARTGLR